ncbi:MAG: hypothetical protein IJC97_00955 [Oscillospiraceae bacterium]|nr:hypothetical protein [Oscillospiraceae bacterium]
MVQLDFKAQRIVDAKQMNIQFDMLCKLFGQPKEDIYIYICRSQYELKKRLHIVNVLLPDWVVGANHNGKIAILNKKQLDARGFHINTLCAHEMVHVFVNQFVANCPLWLNEGLAQNLVPEPKNTANAREQIISQKLLNPYKLSYDSGLYYVSKIIVGKLFKIYGKTQIVTLLKKCTDFEDNNIFGYTAIEALL